MKPITGYLSAGCTFALFYLLVPSTFPYINGQPKAYKVYL